MTIYSGPLGGQGMKLEESGCGIAGTRCDFAWARPPGNTEQQADQQRSPQQTCELLGERNRIARKQSRCPGLGHDFAQGGAGLVAPNGIQRTRHSGGRNRLADRQSEYSNDCGMANLAEKIRAEGDEHLL